MRSRLGSLASRRRSMVSLLIALVVARVVITVAEGIEARLSWWSLVLTLAIGIEAWRGWQVSRAAREEGLEAQPIPDSVWDRLLRPVERWGPAVLYAMTAVFVAGYLVLRIDGTSRDTLLDVTAVVREAVTAVVILVLVAGYLSVRGARTPTRAGRSRT